MKCDIYLQLHSIFLILLTVLDALDCIGLTIHNPQEVVHHSHCTCFVWITTWKSHPYHFVAKWQPLNLYVKVVGTQIW